MAAIPLWFLLHFRGVFVENAGQMERDIAYASLHPAGLFIGLDGKIWMEGVIMDFGSIPSRVRGRDMAVESVSFFHNGISLSRIPAYHRLILEDVYPYIDAEVMLLDGKVEIQFIIRPGGSPQDIVMRVSGGRVESEDGEILIRTDRGTLRIGRIRAYQGIQQVPVESSVDGDSITFVVGEFDSEWSLVIDPVFTTLVASPKDDHGFAMAIDGDGNVYMAGATFHSSMFAPDRNYFGTTSGRDTADVFVTKLSPDLSTHLATAIIGSCGWDYARDIAIGEDGSIYIAGWTTCPSTFAPERSFFGDTGGVDVFVSRLSSSLDEHLSTAIVSSSGLDYAYGLSLGPDGSVYVAGYTADYSTFAPSRVVFGETGSYDAFVSRLSPDLSDHLNSAIVGSGGMDGAMDVVVDDSGNVFLSGYTWSSGTFAPDRTILGDPGSMDAFVSRLSSDLNVHVATAILASPGLESGNALYVSDSGTVYLGGWTDSPQQFAPQRTIVGVAGNLDGFVSALPPFLDGHIWSLILASDGEDGVESISWGDSALIVAGYTGNGNTFSDGRMVVGTTGGKDAFVVALVDTQVLWTLILASDSEDVARSVDVAGGVIYVAGHTEGGSGFAGGAVYMGSGGGRDVFVSRLEEALKNTETSPGRNPRVILSGRTLILEITRPDYVGFEVYSAGGRLLLRSSRGILPAGIHRIRIPLDGKGVFVIFVRIGSRIERLTMVAD